MNRQRNWLKIVLVILLLLGVFGAGFFIQRLSATAFVVQQPESTQQADISQMYSWTTALCGSDGKCLDVIVACNGTTILNVTPTSGVVEHYADWQDPRGGNRELCPSQQKGSL